MTAGSTALPAVPCTTPIHHTPVETLLTDPESGIKFARSECADCGRWMGDTQIQDE